VWTISALAAGAAGVGLSGFGILNSVEMTLIMVNAVAAALLAGFERIPQAMLAAAGIGALTGAVSSMEWVGRTAGLKESLGFIVVVAVVVLFRPRSLSLERA
jgi:branched-subunit amino acid ABC-type transport system permease component